MPRSTRTPIAPIERRSLDGRFDVHLEPTALALVLGACASAGDHETGGILVGKYSPDLRTARITGASTAPADGRSGRTQFVRGIRGLQAWLAQLWARRSGHYLGEWHFHPYSDPSPSLQDVRQMADIANSPSYHCRQPVLLVVGGDPCGRWLLHLEVVESREARHLLLEAPQRSDEGQRYVGV